jgi:mannose-6-phosphate isomerase-like protein (cupin superfamily)
MKRFLYLTAAAMLVTSPLQAKGMKWMDAAGAGLPAGAQMAVVKGDPGKAGDFTVLIKMPANYAVPPHHHPTDEIVRVMGAGQLSYGMGDKLDKTNVGSLTKGYHVTMGAGMNHYVFNTDPVEVQVSGMGPFQITYVDPKDDPRTK